MGATPKKSKNATKVNVATPLTIIERINDTMKYQNYSTIEGSNRRLDKAHVQILTTITDLLFIYTGSGNTKKFQSGELEFINEKESDKLLKTILEVKPYVPNKSFVRRGLYFIMKQTQGEYSKMGNAIIRIAKEKASSGLTFSSDETSFKNELTQIYQKEFGII